MELASRDEERRQILVGLGTVRHIEALRYVLPYLDGRVVWIVPALPTSNRQPVVAEGATQPLQTVAKHTEIRILIHLPPYEWFHP
jgi:hypothetical protein